MHNARNRIGVGAFVVIALLVTANAVREPFYNWDLLAYVASALAIDVNDPAVVHARTWAIARASLPDDALGKLTGETLDWTGPSREFRRLLARDPDAFAAQLPYYRGRALYVLPVYAAFRVGINPITAAVAISAVGALGCALVTLLWLCRIVPGWLAAVLAAGLVTAGQLLVMVRVATPDTLAALVVLAAAFLLVEERRFVIALVLLAIGALARPETAVTGALLLAILALLAPAPRSVSPRQLASGAALLVLVTVGLHVATASPSWWTYFHHHFVAKVIDPTAFELPFSIGTYLAVLTGRLTELGSPRFLAFLVLGASSLVLAFTGKRDLRLPGWMIAWALAAIAAHFVVFPALWHRYLLASYLVIGIMAVQVLKARTGLPAAPGGGGP